MAGLAKPDVKGLGKEAKYKVINFSCYGGSGSSNTECGLFDSIYSNSWDSTQAFYWYNNDHFVEIQIFDKCNIWRTGNGSYPEHHAKLKILKLNENGHYDDITNSITQIVTIKNEKTWEKTILDLPKGQYKFCYNNGVRLDAEWYIEKLVVSKHLIKQNNQYYSLKSSFRNLGQPKDNIELEKWYKQNGIDDLSILVEKKNSKSADLQLDKNDIYKTIISIDLNAITNKIEYINEDNKKEIKYNTEEYQLLDLIKKKIGNKFQIGKWEENRKVIK